jgi:hypothetical protein
VTSSCIYLLDVAKGEGVEAELLDAIEEAQLADWQTMWQPMLSATIKELSRQKVAMSQWPQSWHWNWRTKMAQIEGLLAFRGFSVICEGVTQGLMRIDLNGLGREPGQKGMPLVYVDYLEVAPWNRTDLGGKPRYRGVGTALLAAAVALSLEEGFKGRVGLHSLPQADGFYSERCGMTNLGPDPEVQGLKYFEMTPDQARKFLNEEAE